MFKLFVSGFPLDITEIELVQLFGPYSHVRTIKIVRDKKTGICKGYAFLEMADQEEVNRAVEALNNSPIGDRLLTVKITEDKPATLTPKYVKVEKPSGILKKKRPRK
ncbi:MAG: recognition motif protein [Mucilaginibacter sp.]|nr:recognition motif protein [Mucilaginibacter sp.]